ncbi:MAG: hypothetical protein AAFU67_15520, partial [Bacteroidota bacterium]
EQDIPEENIVAFSVEELIYQDNNEVIVDELDLLLCHGLLSDETRQIILTAINSLDPFLDDFPEARFNLALYLIMISPDFNVIR